MGVDVGNGAFCAEESCSSTITSNGLVDVTRCMGLAGATSLVADAAVKGDAAISVACCVCSLPEPNTLVAGAPNENDGNCGEVPSRKGSSGTR